ncbi:hypothetical protein [Paenibacillus lutrae]|uniref:Uncharacterized protein n=1 Tax=Paenibacillus lutrae TaxID=2078573 RepID=A0A7X3FJF7_9BACL|nr:hypothetical protein [Paenibacillus lutrae]MVP00806.1 hypothetical protein [Paenibacillus lutrae]
MDSRLSLFLGNPIFVDDILPIYSPTVNDIAAIGELQYNVFLTLASFNKENILKHLLRISEEDYTSFEDANSYDLLTSAAPILQEITKSLSFFMRETVLFDEENRCFTCSKGSIHRDNYKQVAGCIQEANGIHETEQSNIFKNEKARKMFTKLQKLRAQHKKQESASLHLKDILSILCQADGNGIHIRNVGRLTIYQIYEQFERMNIKEQHSRLLKVWANGYLGKDDKLPEWIVRTKL